MKPTAMILTALAALVGVAAPARGDEDALDELGDVVVARGGYVLIDANLATGRDVLAELRG